MTVFYITKYALSSGIFTIDSKAEVEAWHKPGGFMVRDTRRGYHGYFGHHEAFTDFDAAIADAERRRDKKIVALKEQISKLEKLSFGSTPQ